MNHEPVGQPIQTLWQIPKVIRNAGILCLGCVLLALPLAPQASSPLQIPFQIDERQGILLVEARANERSILLIVDTGSTWTVLHPTVVGLKASELAATKIAKGGAGMRGEAMAWEANFKLQAREWKNRRVVLMNLDHVSEYYGKRIDGFLGQDLMQEFSTVTIDYRKKKLILTP